MLEELKTASKVAGLKMNIGKIKFMSLEGESSLSIDSQIIEKVNRRNIFT